MDKELKDIFEDMRTCHCDCDVRDCFIHSPNNEPYIYKIKSLFRKWALEKVGEDDNENSETVIRGYSLKKAKREVRNELRAEIRAMINGEGK